MEYIGLTPYTTILYQVHFYVFTTNQGSCTNTGNTWRWSVKQKWNNIITCLLYLLAVKVT